MVNKFIYFMFLAFLYSHSAPASMAEDMFNSSLETQAKSLSRSAVVYFKNSSSCELNRVTHDLDEGIWLESPPVTINSSKWTAWATGGSSMLSGTVGWVEYSCEHGRTKIKWMNPYVGSNEQIATVDSAAHSIEKSGGEEKYHTLVRYYFK